MSLTPEQQSERLKGIGASEVAAVCGLSPWRKPVDIYAVKRGLIAPFEGNEFTKHGNGLEPYICQQFEEATGAKMLTVAEYCGTPEALERFGSDEIAYAIKYGMLRSPATAPVFASPDRIARFADGLCCVEAKNVGERQSDKWGDTSSDKYPVEYYIQVQSQLAVTGLKTGYLCAFIGGNDFRWYRIDRDADTIRMMLDRCITFWDNHVLTGEPPGEMTDSAAWKAILKDRFPQAAKDKKAVVTVADDDPDMMGALEAIAASKAATARLGTAKMKLMERIGNGYKIQNSKLSAVLVKSDKPSSKIDWKAIAQELAELCNEQDTLKGMIAKNTKTGEPKEAYVRLEGDSDD